MANSIYQKIRTIQPGQAIRLSGDAKVWTTLERSGNGETIRYVRHTPNSSAVFHVVNWSQKS